jgi:hypothetical protein
MANYETVTEAVKKLGEKGYTYNFNLGFDCLECKDTGQSLKPDEFEIDEVHRFEGNTDPGDENVLYAISSDKHGLKGVLLNAYGMYADGVTDTLLAKLKIHH